MHLLFLTRHTALKAWKNAYLAFDQFSVGHRFILDTYTMRRFHGQRALFE